MKRKHSSQIMEKERQREGEGDRQIEGERGRERGEKEADRKTESRWAVGMEVERVHRHTDAGGLPCIRSFQIPINGPVHSSHYSHLVGDLGLSLVPLLRYVDSRLWFSAPEP